MPTLAIIILTFNSASYIENCLESIFNFYIKELTEGKLELLVIDNNSTDNTVSLAKKYLAHKNIYKLSTIKIHENRQNSGFGSGLNTGVELTKAPYITFINPDSKVLDGNLFEMKLVFDGKEKAAIVGGKIIGPDKKPELSAGSFLNLVPFLFWISGFERIGKGFRYSPTNFQKVDFVSGAFMMVRRDYFEKIGMFDKNIFMYLEDMEICYRAYKYNFEVYFYPGAVLEHEKHGSSNRSYAIVGIYKGIMYFYKKHKSKPSYFLVKFLLWLKAVFLIIVGKLTHNTYLTNTYEKAIKVC